MTVKVCTLYTVHRTRHQILLLLLFKLFIQFFKLHIYGINGIYSIIVRHFYCSFLKSVPSVWVAIHHSIFLSISPWGRVLHFLQWCGLPRPLWPRFPRRPLPLDLTDTLLVPGAPRFACRSPLRSAVEQPSNRGWLVRLRPCRSLLAMLAIDLGWSVNLASESSSISSLAVICQQ